MTALRVISLVVFLGGCASVPHNAYCKLAEPITYCTKKGKTCPHADTQGTVRQIVGHNAVWKSQNCPTKE